MKCYKEIILSEKNRFFYYINYIQILLFLILNLYDMLTTYHFLGYNGIIESNQLAIPLLENPLLLFSLIGLLVLFFIIVNLYSYYKLKCGELLRFFLYGTLVINLLSVLVILNNYYILWSVY